MIYALLRAIAGVALRWYYRAIQVDGVDRIPRDRPLLLVVNHPNALVDALLVGWIVPRRVLITAKSTLFSNPIANLFLRLIGVVPLRRAADAAATSAALDPRRNRETFRAVVDALAKRGAVLIFPEGISHDNPSLAPLKTGAARMALEAIDRDSARNLAIVPIGLVFERKDAPRTRVLVQVGEPILVEEWRAAATSVVAPAALAEALTGDIDTRLRAITLNYASADDAARAVRLASTIAALFDSVPPIGDVGRGLGVDAAIARRIEEFAARLPSADASMRLRADLLVRRLDATQHVASKHGILLEDVGVELDARSAARFLVREGWLLALGAPFAVWGRLNHWLPFRAARAVAMRSVESAADPAMRALVAGTAFVLVTYLAQTALVGAVWGPLAAATYLITLPIAAEVNFALSDRMGRARQRARAFLRFRRDRALQDRLAYELDLLRDEVIALDQALREPAAAAML